MDPVQQSKQFKSEGDRLIKDSGVLEMLKEYGEVRLGGGYALNVMGRRDLDFYVITEKHDIEKVAEVVSKIVKGKYFHILHYGNWHEFKPQAHEGWAEDGYYMALYAWIDGYEWKCDVWLMTPDQCNKAETTPRFLKLLESDVDGSKRRMIVEIKKAMREGVKYKPGIDGKLIYKAVLEEGVSTVEEFNNWLLARKK